ncbi:MAG: serine/threonine protein kinase [Deltaproteobacteria bacterium]|nr:serine/threonine protein kinase [Deltaproteobacteria bacterium]
MAEAVVLPSVGAVLGGRYRLAELIGTGTSGAVFRALRDDGPAFAIKVLRRDALAHDELRRRFEREASALSTLTHPNVIGVLELGEVEGAPFLVMELLEGETLDALLSRENLAPEVSVEIADQLLAGLAHAHAHGILHRDVKPANVFLARQPSGGRIAKLLDFGLVKFGHGSAFGVHTTLTERGAILGTPAYMSPEQVLGREVDARTDVYAAGVVLFELMTGTWPFVEEDVTDMFRAHARDPVPALGSVREGLVTRPELDALVRKAMAKRPPDRFADAREMRIALARVPRPVARLGG